MDHSHVVDNIINQLCAKTHLTSVSNYNYMIEQLCPVALDIFSKEPSLLELQAPIKIAGDLNGQYSVLQSIFGYGGCPPQSNYLFLGNFVVQPGNWMDTILLLLAFKIKYPTNIFLVKGNLDAGITLCCVDEIDEKSYFNSDSERILYDCLKSLPVAALINDKIICTHGGLSPDLHNLDQIRHMMRPTDLPYPRLLLDLLGPHSRRLCFVGDIFVAEEVQFLEKYDLRLICCGLQFVSNYKDFAAHRVVSISTSDQMEYHKANKVSDVTMMMSVDVNLKCSFHDLRYKRALWSYHISMAARIQTVLLSGVNFASGTKHVEGTSNPCTAKSDSSSGENPPSSKPAAKHRNGSMLARWTSKPNSGNSASTTKSGSSQGANHSVIKSAANYRSLSPEHAERVSKSNFVSGTGTRTPARATKYRSNSPGFKSELNYVSGISGTESESKPGTNPSNFDFDPASLYRSKSPGVKRFLGAKV